MNNNRIFYICSYGGCGSKCLMNILKKYGKVEHLHSRYPPNKLEFVGTTPGVDTEWFNGVPVPEDQLHKYTIIYIYKNPINAIYSRYHRPDKIKYQKLHQKYVQLEKNIMLKDVLEKNDDLYKIKEFYKNYTTPNSERNYKIISIKYEDLFEKTEELEKLLNIGPIHIEKRETKREYPEYDKLYNIYKDLIDEMNNKPFIEII